MMLFAHEDPQKPTCAATSTTACTCIAHSSTTSNAPHPCLPPQALDEGSVCRYIDGHSADAISPVDEVIPLHLRRRTCALAPARTRPNAARAHSPRSPWPARTLCCRRSRLRTKTGTSSLTATSSSRCCRFPPRGAAALPPLPGAPPCLSVTAVTSPCTLSGGTAFDFFYDGCRRTRVLSPQRAHEEHLEHHGHASEAAPDDAFDLSPLAGNESPHLASLLLPVRL
jgi:hypothetical protein